MSLENVRANTLRFLREVQFIDAANQAPPGSGVKVPSAVNKLLRSQTLAATATIAPVTTSPDLFSGDIGYIAASANVSTASHPIKPTMPNNTSRKYLYSFIEMRM